MPLDRKDYDQMYNDASAGWQLFNEEARISQRAYEGDQWPAKFAKVLKEQNRHVFTFNGLHRLVQAITGYERKTRLMLKIAPTGAEEDAPSGQFTRLIMHQMQYNAFEVLSDAFKHGALIQGHNLVALWPDRRHDIQFGRLAYNQFLLDPTMTRDDLSDCQYVMMRKYLLPEVIRRLLPQGVADRIDWDKLKSSGAANTGRDSKYNYLDTSEYQRRALPYDEVWRRTTQENRYVVHRQTGRKARWQGRPEQLEAVLAQYPLELTSLTQADETVELALFIGVNDEPVWTGADPYRLGDFGFLWVHGYFDPEENEAQYRLRSVLSAARDPQVADNIRISQMIDIFEAHSMTPDVFEKGALLDLQDAYKTGQGDPLILKDGAVAGGKWKQRSLPDIPGGMLALHQLIDEKISEVPGFNQELFGTETKDVPGILAKLRQGAALTMFQELFDHLRFQKRRAGRLMVKLIQGWPDEKTLRLLKEPLAPGFREIDFERYDCVPQEAMLTESQRELAYAEIMVLKQTFPDAPIPWSAILDLMPIQLKDKLKEHILREDQANQWRLQMEQKMNQITAALEQAKLIETIASAQSKQSTAELNRVKAAEEAAKVRTENVSEMLDILRRIQQAENEQNQPLLTRR